MEPATKRFHWVPASHTLVSLRLVRFYKEQVACYAPRIVARENRIPPMLEPGLFPGPREHTEYEAVLHPSLQRHYAYHLVTCLD